MSLINDALKRASQAQKSRPPESAPAAPMQPAHHPRRSALPMVAGVAIFLLLAAAGWLLWKSFEGRKPPATMVATVAPKPAAPAPAPKTEPAPAPPPVPAVVPTPAPVAVVVPPAKTNPPPVVPTPAPAVVTTPPPAPAVVTPPPQPFPELKLQAILYIPSDPKALINGRSLGENERVAGARVVKIERDKVTVEFQGQTKDLRLD